MNLESTRIYCPACGTFHPADYAEADGAAFWRLHCPKGDRDLALSSDARLFRRFRAQARPLPVWYRRSLTNCLVHVNDDCSLQCPVCFENAPRSGWRMSMDELRRIAHRLRTEVKPVNIMITGGEPTEHPQILEIVRTLARECGFHCYVLTNGVKIGSDPCFAAGLKEIPVSYYEASMIDGANGFQRFFKITLPCLSPIVLYNLIMQTISAFMAFTQAFVITNGGPNNGTLMYALYVYRQAFDYDGMGYACAMSWVMLVVMSLITLVIFRTSKMWVFSEADS